MGTPPRNPPLYSSREQRRAQKAQWQMQRARYRGYVRGSLVGPLLLIAIGVIALLMTTHRLDAARFWNWYGRWWPLILIGAGVVLALESLACSAYSRIRLGGGVVLLAILLAILGVAAAHRNVNWQAIGNQLKVGDNVDLSQAFGSRHQAQEQVTHPIPAGAVFVVQNPHGNVTISAGNDGSTRQMLLTLDKTVYTGSDAEAARKLETLEPLITSSDRTVTVHMPTGGNRTADMNIVLPADVPVEVYAGYGDVAVRNRKAAVSIHAEHGDVQLAGITGEVHTAMNHGDFSAANIQGNLNLTGHMDDVALSSVAGSVVLNGDFFGDVHLKQLAGPIHLHSSRTDLQVAKLPGSVSLDGDKLSVVTAEGPIVLSTAAKNITLRGVSGSLRVHNSNGAVVVKTMPPMGTIEIQNSNGPVNLSLPGNAKFSIQATANEGEIHNDFNLPTENDHDRSIVSGQVGGGGPPIKISADKGDISLRKN